MREFALSAILLSCAACAGPTAKPAADPAKEAAAVPAEPKALLEAIRQSYGSGKYAVGLELVKRLVEITPDKVTAYDRIGSTYYALGRGEEALGMWETALTLEKDAARRSDLSASVVAARLALGLPPPKPETAEPKPKARPRPRPKAPADPAQVEALYQEGLLKYADSEYLAAASFFRKALALDPGHELSRKALERLKMKAP